MYLEFQKAFISLVGRQAGPGKCNFEVHTTIVKRYLILLSSHSKICTSVFHKHVTLNKTAMVQQKTDPLSGS